MFKSEDYLPSRFHSIKEFYDFCVANDPEFDNALEIKDKGLNNRFPNTADIDGVRIWERILSLTPNASDTLEDRRFRIISNFQKRAPFTWAELNRMLAFLCGADDYTLEREAEFILKVSLTLDSESMLQSVIQMLEEIVPMHILLHIVVTHKGHFKIRVGGAYKDKVIFKIPINNERKRSHVLLGTPVKKTVKFTVGEKK